MKKKKGRKNKSSKQYLPVNIVIPMAGSGTRFAQANYSFPKPLIDVNGKPMIQLVVENLKPTLAHRYIFICQKEHYDTYSLQNIFNNITDKAYECVQLTAQTQGAACTVLTAVDYFDSDAELVIANSDQMIDVPIDDFIRFARKKKADGAIMTFNASHPKWSYARLDKKGRVIETAEKRVISDQATVGIYYFRHGKQFVECALSMIQKDIRVNNEYYVCPVFNELILRDGLVHVWEIKPNQMHGMGTPEDLRTYLDFLNRTTKT